MMQLLIQTPTPNLQASLDFYQKLNFEVLSEKNSTIVSDGRAVIEINPDRMARAGVKLFSKDWQKTLALIKDDYPITKLDNGYLVGDPSGVWVYLINGEGPELEVSGSSKSILGNFSGLSIETIAIEKSMELWQSLGFENAAGDADQGWVSLTRGEFSLSLMKPLACPHLFFNPSITYFNGENNLKVIENVKKSGIPITEEITHFNKEGKVDNIIIRDPGGLGAFLFND